MIVIPIVVFTLLMGIRRISPSMLGKIGGKVMALYAVTTLVAHWNNVIDYSGGAWADPTQGLETGGDTAAGGD